MTQFLHIPTPRLLQWLSGGTLALRLRRTLRGWVWLRFLYGDGSSPLVDLPPTFRYGLVRDRLFAPSHPRADTATVADMEHRCRGSHCLCQTPTHVLLFQQHHHLDKADWVAELADLSGFSVEALEEELRACAFATVHRTLRDDLTWLTKLGWLESVGRGQWRKKAPQDWPPCPITSWRAMERRIYRPRSSKVCWRCWRKLPFCGPSWRWWSIPCGSASPPSPRPRCRWIGLGGCLCI